MCKWFHKGCLILSIAIAATFSAHAQEKADTITQRSNVLVYGSDTLPIIHIPELQIHDLSQYNYLKSRKYRRTIRNVKRAYPYAVIARDRLKDLDHTLASMKNDKQRKTYMKEQEKLIMDEFESQVRKLTLSQGMILVKLIDRETGDTSYEVIKELRGGFTAFFWQGVARLFGNDLKMQFEPEGRDKVIEDIVNAMEQGYI